MDEELRASFPPATDEGAPKRLLPLRVAQAAPGRLAALYAPVERRLEWIVERLKSWAVVELIQLGSTLFVAVSAGIYLWNRDDQVAAQREAQRLARQSAAWQVINGAQGKGGSGGRIEALRDLARDTVPLDGVVLTDAYLVGLRLVARASLVDAVLNRANLGKARLPSVDLTRAQLIGARLNDAVLFDTAHENTLRKLHPLVAGYRLAPPRLVGARLDSAHLERALLWRAYAPGATLSHAHLTAANLHGAELTRAVLDGADLTEAILDSANLEWAALADAELADASLRAVNLRGSCLRGVRNWEKLRDVSAANISHVREPPAGFVEWALRHGAVRDPVDSFPGDPMLTALVRRHLQDSIRALGDRSPACPAQRAGARGEARGGP